MKCRFVFFREKFNLKKSIIISEEKKQLTNPSA